MDFPLSLLPPPSAHFSSILSYTSIPESPSGHKSHYGLLQLKNPRWLLMTKKQASSSLNGPCRVLDQAQVGHPEDLAVIPPLPHVTWDPTFPAHRDEHMAKVQRVGSGARSLLCYPVSRQVILPLCVSVTASVNGTEVLPLQSHCDD